MQGNFACFLPAGVFLLKNLSGIIASACQTVCKDTCRQKVNSVFDLIAVFSSEIY